MSPPTAGTDILRRRGLSVTLLVGALFGAYACGGSEPSEEVATPPSEAAEAAAPSGASVSAGAGSTAPLGTGFIMVSQASQLHLTEPSYLEESDCSARVSALGDAEEYAGCMEMPPAALCLQVAEGTRESDKWWDCFVEEAACEEAHSAHEVIVETGGYVREILLDCTETEMASVFGTM